MRKASYESYNTSHYALGLDNYLHFTSPIRRGCDMHLILRGYNFDDETMKKYCNYFNEAENIQTEVEKTISMDKIFENINEKIGHKINGVTINVNNIEIYRYRLYNIYSCFAIVK